MVELIAGFSTGKGFLSWAIRKVLGTPYSHTYLYKKDTEKVWEAQLEGVQKLTRVEWLNNGNKVIAELSILVTEERWQEIKKFADSHAGTTEYGTGQLFWNFMEKIGLKFNVNNGAKKMICSEFLVRAFLEELGIDESVNLDLIDPEEAYKMFDEIDHPNVKRLL